MLAQSVSRSSISPWDFARGCLRFSIFFMIIVAYILHHEIVKLFLRDESKRLQYYVKSVSWHTRLGLWLFNIRVDDQTKTDQPGLLVSNHLSYIDVLVLFSKYPALFITSKEIENVFLLGRLTKLAGCFHVERRKHLRTPEMIEQELAQMKTRLNQGMSLFLFPEGTSSDGSTVLPYKAHFFQTAIDLNLPVTALCLKYDWEGRHPDEICWYGDMAFAGHLFGLCLRPGVKVTLKEISAGGKTGQTRHEMAREICERTRDEYEKH